MTRNGKIFVWPYFNLNKFLYVDYDNLSKQNKKADHVCQIKKHTVIEYEPIEKYLMLASEMPRVKGFGASGES